MDAIPPLPGPVRRLGRRLLGSKAVRLAAFVCAFWAVAPAAAQTGEAMTVVVSSVHAGAHPVTLTATLRYEQQCGYPGVDPVVLTLPAPVPSAYARSSVLVDGKAARAIAAHGRTVTIEMPKPPQILCDSITIGPLRLVLHGLKNPAAAGTYRVTARKGTRTFVGALVIRAA